MLNPINDVTKFKGHRAIYLEKVWTRKALFSIKITTSKNNYQFFGQIFIIPNKTVWVPNLCWKTVTINYQGCIKINVKLTWHVHSKGKNPFFGKRVFLNGTMIIKTCHVLWLLLTSGRNIPRCFEEKSRKLYFLKRGKIFYSWWTFKTIMRNVKKKSFMLTFSYSL